MAHNTNGTPPDPESSHPLSLKLSVPADRRFLAIVQGFVRELAGTAGLPSDEVLLLEVASEEAFDNILKHAYPGCSAGDIHVGGILGAGELEISFQDEGIPFETRPDQYPDSLGEDGEVTASGLGFRLIRNAADEVRFENLGRRGKVLRLIKRLSEPLGTGPVQEVHAVPPAPEQEYEIRPMRPGEAEQVPRLFWLAYGYSYKNEDFYRPEGLLHLIGSGHVISYVAVGENGEVAGHAGLLRPDPVPMAEMALLVVAPAHRGRHIMESLAEALADKAVAMGLHGLSINPVTSHPISQKETYRLGFVPCGLDLAACPPREFKALVSGNIRPQRESYIHCFRYLIPPPPVTVYVPARHRAMVARIYQTLTQPCTMGEPAPAVSSGDFRFHFDRTLQKGVITVLTADGRRWPEILQVAQDMEEMAGAEVVDLDLPLAQPATPLLFDLAEEAGFVFTGIRPCQSPDGDSARLQRLCVPFDMGRLRIHPGFGDDLVDYVAGALAAQRK